MWGVTVHFSSVPLPERGQCVSDLWGTDMWVEVISVPSMKRLWASQCLPCPFPFRHEPGSVQATSPEGCSVALGPREKSSQSPWQPPVDTEYE